LAASGAPDLVAGTLPDGLPGADGLPATGAGAGTGAGGGAWSANQSSSDTFKEIVPRDGG
jgi:hypothetical protein